MRSKFAAIRQRGVVLPLALVMLVMVTLSGFKVPFSSPVQLEKNHPLLGRAVTVTTEPAGYTLFVGLRLTVPEPRVWIVRL